MRLIEHFAEISANYDALFCDVWGVVHNGREPIPGIVECLGAYKETGGKVVLLTNAPRPAKVIPPQLHRIGIPDHLYDHIVTSGDATIYELNRRAPANVLHVGPPRDHGLFDGSALTIVEETKDAQFVLCSGLYDDETETPEDYAELLEEMKALDLDMICANPDIQVVRGTSKVYCAGAIALAYDAIGGNVIYGGKPHKPIYDLAFSKLEAGGDTPPRERILAIGDGPDTDIKGANNQGLDVLFVGGGLHAGAFEGGNGADFLKEAERLFAARGVRANYIIRTLVH